MEDLREAIISGEVGKIEWLLSQPDLASQLRGNEEAVRGFLFEGIKRGHTDAVLKLLSAHECNLLLTDTSGKTALHEATIQGNLMVAIRMLALKGELIDLRDSKGHTALHYAAFLGHADIVSHLIQHGADVNILARGNWSALHYAAKGGHTRIVMSLLSAGSITTLKLLSPDPNENNKTAAELAAAQGFVHVAKMINDFGKEKIDTEKIRELRQSMAVGGPLRTSSGSVATSPTAMKKDLRMSKSTELTAMSNQGSQNSFFAQRDEDDELLNAMKRRLIRLENQQGRIDQVSASLNTLSADVSTTKDEHRKKFTEISTVISKIAPNEVLNRQKDDWLTLMEEMSKLNTANQELQNRLGALETRLRYLEYILLAFLFIYVVF